MTAEEIDPTRSQPSLVLIERIKQGDPSARDELIRRYWPRLERWAQGRLPVAARDLNDTADLVQDTMVAALSRIPEFVPRHDGALRAYFRVALMNRIRSLATKARQQGERIGLDSALAAATPSPLEEAIGHEAIDCYERALARLRPDDREAIVLRVELDLSYEEIAAELEKPTLIAARKAVSRALYRLAHEMKRDA